jgi:hypothetical protein
MLYVCVQTFDVTENLENFWKLNITVSVVIDPPRHIADEKDTLLCGQPVWASASGRHPSAASERTASH